MTLEEWKEIQEKIRAKINFQVRKPGEGEKKGQWKNTRVLQKTEGGEHPQVGKFNGNVRSFSSALLKAKLFFS